MMEPIQSHPHGAFSWLDLNTTNVRGAKEFYNGLFGWTFEDMPTGTGPDYTMFHLDGLNVAAANPMVAEQQQQGVPPYWTAYVTVNDLEATAARVAELGGQLVMPPFDVLEAGRMAMLIDPTGAMLALWEPRNHIGVQLRDLPGALTWNELMTADPRTARDFYAELLGWEFDTMEMDFGPYYVVKTGERSYGGIMAIPPEMSGMPPNWGVYFLVDDVEATAVQARALGGTVVSPNSFVPGVGHMAVLQDPQGASFSVIKYVEMDA